MDQRPDQLNTPDQLSEQKGSIDEGRFSEPRVDEGAAASETLDDRDGETERIKADIEDTRAEMGQTLNEIQERLSPEHVMGQVKETVREATIGKVERVMERVNETISNVTEPAMEAMGRAGEKLKDAGSSVTNVVRQNPIPFALMGLGLGMFIVSRVRSADGRTTHSRTADEVDREMGYGMATPRYGMGRQHGTSSGEYAGASRQYGTSGRSALSQVKETANGLAHATAEKVSHLGHQAQEGAMWAGRGLQRLVQENPLAVGAAAVAVGAAVGLALPVTQIEHEYMGEASEKTIDKAQQVARDAMDRVKTATQSQTGGQQPGQPRPQTGEPGHPQAGKAGQPHPQAGEPGQPSVSQTGQSKSAQPGQPIPTA